MKFKNILCGALALVLLSGCGASSGGQSGTTSDQNSSDAQSSTTSDQNSSNAQSNNTDNSPASSDEKINIGIVAPRSGGVSVYGIASSNGTQMAFDEINSAGGINGKQINYILQDDKGDPTEAVNAYNKLANNDKVSAVIGGVTSGPTTAMVSAAQADGIPIITPTATNEKVTTYGDNVFRACFLDAYQSKAMAAFALADLESKTAAIMYNSADDYSTGLAEVFKETFEANGGTIVSYEAYITDDKDFKSQLTNIKAAAPDILFLPDYYNVIALIAKQVKEVGITSTMLGTDGWDGVFTALDDISLIENAYYCAHYAVDDPDTTIQTFVSNYNELYGQMPNSFAALGYDAARIMVAAIEKAGSTDKDAIVNALKDTSYNGITGSISFDSEGNPIKPITILKVENQKTKLFQKIMY